MDTQQDVSGGTKGLKFAKRNETHISKVRHNETTLQLVRASR